MLPAQPPKSRLRAGTRKDTFRMWSWSGRICSAKRPSKLMMVSKARDPQMTAAMVLFLWGSGVEGKQAVAGHARGAAGVDPHAHGARPLAGRGDHAVGGAEFRRGQHAAHHGLVL